MYTSRYKRNHGFTIVELIIVIVVIGILAGIVIITFNGVQNRARNTQRITAVNAWLNTIALYSGANHVLPPNFTNNHICLGTGNPTDLDGVLTDEDCYGTGNVKHPSPTTNTALSAFGTLPTFPSDKLDVSPVGPGITAGLSVRSYDTLNPGTSDAKTLYPMMYYWLYGNNADCGAPGVLAPVPSTSNYSTTNSLKYTANDGKFTRCVVMVPDPTR